MTAPDPLLLEALEALSDLPDTQQADPDHCERVARWRLACGDAEAAARWRFWSLDPPRDVELREALAQLWRQLGDPSRALMLLPEQRSWEQLAALLEQGAIPEAQVLQRELLAAPPALQENRLLEIVAAWQAAEQPAEALALLEALAQFRTRRGDVVSPQIANALAHHLEELERFEEAAPWWIRSLAVDPDQVWPLMRLARQELRCGAPHLTAHYCREVLQRDPSHRWAPDLLREALVAMGARGSLAALGHRSPPAPWRCRQHRWLAPLQALDLPSEQLAGLLARGPVALLPPQAWEAQTELAVWGNADGLALASLAAALQAHPPAHPITLWLLASPEPELQRSNLQQLFRQVQPAVQLRSWPVWDPSQHAAIPTLLLAHGVTPPAGGDERAHCVIWQEMASPHRWQRKESP